MKIKNDKVRERGKIRKGQEEMVGFVLIVIIVAVIVLILLGILIRQGNTTSKESVDVSQFLEGMMQYNTNCSVFAPAYSTIGDLMGECYDGRICSNGNSACDTLNSTIKSMLESTWQVKQGGNLKGFAFQSTYYENETGNYRETNITSFYKGNCTLTQTGAIFSMSHYPGTIRSSMELCY